MTLKAFTITVAARKHHGLWELDGDVVRVASPYGSRRQAVARGKPVDVARAALHQLVADWKPATASEERGRTRTDT